ncbi:MAG: NfeD family protein [Pseudomonadales bacterium]|jgi:membrane protein implicated in regulation of membrane protease activity|nr:NfeD family protein [Pseudomonadales bacterium]MCP5319420.1 NfeD family protein [Pseudomonadales bacterium]MCP5336959.1 NfeD family protein [Pseudomonadales bacterium]
MVKMLYWHWLVLGMALSAIEIFLPTFTALWFGAGAILVGVLLLLIPSLSLAWQIGIWSVASAVATWAWFRFYRRVTLDHTKAGLGRETLLGETALVVRAPAGDKRGMLRFATPKLGAEEWQFFCAEPVEAGDRVVVEDVSGNTLIVTRH